MPSIEGTINRSRLIGGSVKISIAATPDIQVGTITTLDAESEAFVELDESSTKLNPVLNFGIPKGSPGADGKNGVDGKDGLHGENGKDGFSPIVTATETETGAIISITDQNGTTTATIFNGKDGANGMDGKDGAPGANGKDGEPGVDGNGISSITRYYLATSNSGSPEIIEWDGDTTGRDVTYDFCKVSDTILSVDALVGLTGEDSNGETFTLDQVFEYGDNWYTAGSSSASSPELITIFTEPMELNVNDETVTVSPGTYFFFYKDMYYVTKLTVPAKDVTVDTDGWTTEIQLIDSVNKYLWSYEVVEFTDGTTNTSEPVIIGVYGDKGIDGESVDADNYYTKEETEDAIENAIAAIGGDGPVYRIKLNWDPVVSTWNKALTDPELLEQFRPIIDDVNNGKAPILIVQTTQFHRGEVYVMINSSVSNAENIKFTTFAIQPHSTANPITLTLRNTQLNGTFTDVYIQKGTLPYAKSDEIGTLSNLKTTDKSNLVNAINEVNSSLLEKNGIFIYSKYFYNASNLDTHTDSTTLALARKLMDWVTNNGSQKLPVLIWNGLVFDLFSMDNTAFIFRTGQPYQNTHETLMITINFTGTVDNGKYNACTPTNIVAKKINMPFLTFNNTVEYAVTNQYHVTHKKYVDTAIDDAKAELEQTISEAIGTALEGSY